MVKLDFAFQQLEIHHHKNFTEILEFHHKMSTLLKEVTKTLIKKYIFSSLFDIELYPLICPRNGF